MGSLVVVLITLLFLILQAKYAQRRMQLMVIGATLCALTVLCLENVTFATILRDIPWDVLMILLALGVISSLVADSNVFDVIAVRSSLRSKGSYSFLLLTFMGFMYLISSLVNNITALLLILPVLITVLKCLGATQRYVSLCFSMIIVSCNLGGAASPIGDFPAILLLASGSMSFSRYLVLAFPATAIILVIVAAWAAAIYHYRSRVDSSKLESEIALRLMKSLYRNVVVDRTILIPAALIFVGMLALWILGSSFNIGPTVTCFIGLSLIALFMPARAELALRKKVDAEAIVFIACLFVMVSCMVNAGVLDLVATWMQDQFESATALLLALMIGTGVITGVFSAGPSMAAMLPVARAVIESGQMPGDVVYVGLALSVCAGSSFFLTAATSGPLSQSLVANAQMKEQGGTTVQFGFTQFLPYGILSFVTIQAGAIAFVFLSL